MATLVALLLALAVYTLTIYVLNVQGSPEGARPSFDIESAFNIAGQQYGIPLGVPPELIPVVSVLVLIVPAILVFSIVRIIVK